MRNIIFALVLFFLNNITFAQEKKIEIKNLEMNTKKSHFGVIYFKDNKVVFSTEYKRIKNKMGDQAIYKLQVGDVSEAGEIVNVEDFNISKDYSHNVSSVAFSSDYKKVYITTNYSSLKKVYKQKYKRANLRIMVGKYVKGTGYTDFEVLSFCNPDYSYGHPALSPDGSTLYFVANILSAKGATDLFEVKVLGHNKFSKPKNLGTMVNSVRKELFPFVSKDNVLYFSSDRVRGVGALDIYYTKKINDTTYSKAKLVEKPINSRADDFGFILNDDGKSGYFTSKRINRVARARGKSNDDIYFFKMIEENQPKKEIN